VVADRIHVQVRAGEELDGRPYAMRIIRIEPEWLFEQLAHRRQVAVAGEAEPVGEPAPLGEKAHEFAREWGIRAALENHAA
jgi:hypothetical protein